MPQDFSQNLDGTHRTVAELICTAWALPMSGYGNDDAMLATSAKPRPIRPPR